MCSASLIVRLSRNHAKSPLWTRGNFGLIGVVGITITGVVYHVARAHLLELDSWDLVADQILHTVVPILAVLGWFIFGPRGLAPRRVVWLSLLFPIIWMAFTIIRGAIVHWYPYPFADVSALGYGKVTLNGLWILLLYLGLAAGAATLGGWMDTRSGGATILGASRRDTREPR